MKKHFIIIYTKIIQIIIKLFLFPFSKTKKAKLLSGWLVGFIPKISIDIPNTNDKIIFFCPSNTTVFRAETLFKKEPETIKWIKTFEKNDIFWDVGANVGVFSLFAASRGIRTFSFEPSSGNYWVLNKNIFINNYDKLIKALPVAFSNKSKIGVFNMSDIELGGAIYLFGENKNSIEHGSSKKNVCFHQGMIGISIDDFLYNFKIDPPNHLKIDVDSIEIQIIKGAHKLLKEETTKSVMIELDSNNREDINYVSKIMGKSGLKLAEKKHSEYYTPNEFNSIYNYLFSRY